MTHTMLWEKGCLGEMLQLCFKLWPKCRPTDSLLQQYDYDITLCPQGSSFPHVALYQGVVAPRDDQI